MYSIFDNDKKHLCSYEGNKVYDSYNDFLKREIGSFDMEGNVYRNNTLIGKVDTENNLEYIIFPLVVKKAIYMYLIKESSIYQCGVRIIDKMC